MLEVPAPEIIHVSKLKLKLLNMTLIGGRGLVLQHDLGFAFLELIWPHPSRVVGDLLHVGAPGHQLLDEGPRSVPWLLSHNDVVLKKRSPGYT